MIPISAHSIEFPRARILCVLGTLALGAAAGGALAASTPAVPARTATAAGPAIPATPATPAVGAAAPPALAGLPVPVHAKDCLRSGDGYFRAHLGGAITASIDWPNAGTRCEGESRAKPPGVRLSFQRAHSGSKQLLFVFGISGVHEGAPVRDTGVNLTVFVQGTNRIYGTLGDSRCTADSLTQRPLPAKHTYRVEVRGFCTQPAHSVRGPDALLVSTFEFAGPVVYEEEAGATPSVGTQSVATPGPAMLAQNATAMHRVFSR